MTLIRGGSDSSVDVGSDESTADVVGSEVGEVEGVGPAGEAAIAVVDLTVGTAAEVEGGVVGVVTVGGALVVGGRVGGGLGGVVAGGGAVVSAVALTTTLPA